MKQVLISGTGQVEVFETPLPGRLAQSVLVRNAFSLISSGTERGAVTGHGGWLGALEKARDSRDRMDQVWDMVRKVGYRKTWEIVRGKLEDYTPGGYSCAGRVVEVDDPRLPFQPGDPVAGMGVGFANHAEYATLPQNLAVVVPDGVSLEEAAFAALGCIAMQGIRRLELPPGERIGVIGLGLVGQLCLRLLQAMGYQALGMDLNPERVRLAAEAPAEAWATPEADSVARVMELTDGRGLDGVVVCAATPSDEPANLALDLCRQRGRVSVVGDVGLGLKREKMYQKELEVRLSCSYGPGRYDDRYELAGHDYPFGYVRWTERRNLESFLGLLASGRLNIRPLISAKFPVDRAAEAYAQIKAAGANTYGVLLDYGMPEELPTGSLADLRTVRVAPTVRLPSDQRLRVGLIGVGGYARGVHVPNLKRLKRLFAVHAVADQSASSAAVVARTAGAAVAAGDYRALLSDPEIQAVIIATRHATHAGIALEALEAGKHVFVEKPMATTVDEARRIAARAAETGLVVRVGFNRRFAPALRRMREAVGRSGVRLLLERVSIGQLRNDWSNTPEEGGRLLGEGCHFFDLGNWFMGAEPEAVSATFAGPPEVTNPNAAVSLLYPDGSTVVVLYTALGSDRMDKERFEAFGNGRGVRSADYRTLEGFGVSVSLKPGERNDKGQLAELDEFAAAITGRDYPGEGADTRAGLLATWVALAARESAQTGQAVKRTV